MHLRILLSAATLLAGAGLAVMPAALSASAAKADTTVALPVPSMFQMAVDSTNDHLFFSEGDASELADLGGSSANSILVTDFSGNTVATITGQTGVMGITLAPDGSTLYAALSGADAVSAISTSTLQQTALYQLPAGDIPFSVAVQSGELWVSYYIGAVGSSETGIGEFDLSAATPSFETQYSTNGPGGEWGSAPLLAADPSGTGNVLVAIGEDIPSIAATYDTAQDPVTVRAQAFMLPYKSLDDQCGAAQDVAVVPGGAQFMVACAEAPWQADEYSTANLSVQASYPGQGSDGTLFPDAIAVASGTGLIAMGYENDYGPDNIEVFAPGDGTPQLEFDTVGVSAPVPRGLGLSSDGAELFAVVGAGSEYTLNIYAIPDSLTLNGPVAAEAGKPVTLNGALTIGGVGAPAGATITITRTGPDGTTTLTATTGTGGSYALTDTPPGTGSYTYTASYAGDTTASPATSGSLSVTVSLAPAPLTLSATASTAAFGSTVHVTAHLGATHDNRTVTVYARPSGAARPVRLGTGTVNSAGNLTVGYPLAHTTTFSAVFTGDAWYAPATVTKTVTVSAKVSTRISGYYGSKKAGSTTYRLYHHTARLNLTATVAPDKAGECVKVEVQEFRKGAWRASSLSGCHALSKSSGYFGYLTLTRDARNYPYRVRIDYIAGKDTSNLSTDGSWLYFEVEK